MSLTKLKSVRPDRRISGLCHRGAHEKTNHKEKCKGRSCSCNCHPVNLKTPFCIKCETRRTKEDNQICGICSDV